MRVTVPVFLQSFPYTRPCAVISILWGGMALINRINTFENYELWWNLTKCRETSITITLVMAVYIFVVIFVDWSILVKYCI